MPKTAHYSPFTTSRPGARLYHSTASVWLSVDPLSDKYPGVSPYVYCRNNPIVLVDPNGMSDDWVLDNSGNIYWDDNAKNQGSTKQGDLYLGKEGQSYRGTDVWNYYSDGTCEKQAPAIVEADGNNYNAISSSISDIDKADDVLSNISIATTLPIGAAIESAARVSSQIALKSLGGIVGLAAIAPDIIRCINNPTEGNVNKLIVSGIGFGISLIPMVGPIASVIWNSIDTGGGFDEYYK